MPARTQSSVAVSADGVAWFLVNASPDLRAQIEGFPPLWPKAGGSRNSPIQGVLLTNADLDHVLGLMLLREGSRIDVHATLAVRKALCRGLRLDSVLGSFCELRWHEPRSTFAPLRLRDDSPSGLVYRAIPLPGGPPRFITAGTSMIARRKPAGGAEPLQTPLKPREAHNVAFQISDSIDGPRLLIAPGVAAMTPELKQAVDESEAALIDGTFWDDDELRVLVANARTSSEMDHTPISGNDGTLALLRTSSAKRRIYVHINNTNPVLCPGSPERAEVEAAGVQIGNDGMEFEL